MCEKCENKINDLSDTGRFIVNISRILISFLTTIELSNEDRMYRVLLQTLLTAYLHDDLDLLYGHVRPYIADLESTPHVGSGEPIVV